METTEEVRRTILNSPRRAASRQAILMPDRSVPRTSHLVLHLQDAEEFNQRDWKNRKTFVENMLAICTGDNGPMSDEAHFHVFYCVIKQSFRY